MATPGELTSLAEAVATDVATVCRLLGRDQAAEKAEKLAEQIKVAPLVAGAVASRVRASSLPKILKLLEESGAVTHRVPPPRAPR